MPVYRLTLIRGSKNRVKDSSGIHPALLASERFPVVDFKTSEFVDITVITVAREE